MRNIIQEIGEELFFKEEIQSWEALEIFVKILDLGIDPHKFLTNLLAHIEQGKIPGEYNGKITQLIKESVVSESKPMPKTVIMNAVPSHPRRSAPKPKKQGAPKPKEKSPKPAPKATALSEYINNRKIKLSGPEISILKFLANNKYSEAGKALNHYSVNITEFKNNFFNLIKDEDIPSDKKLEIIGDLGFTSIEEARSKVMKFYDIQKAPKREKGGSHQKPPKTSGPLGALSSARNDLGFITNYL